MESNRGEGAYSIFSGRHKGSIFPKFSLNSLRNHLNNTPMNRIHLSAEQFIKALQGEIVLDKEGKKYHFFHYAIYGVKSAGIVVIDQRVVVKEKVEIKADEQSGDIPIFPYSIIIKGGEFQKLFYISGGEFQSEFRILGGEFQSEFRIDGGEFKSFSTKGGEFKSWFNIEGGGFQEVFSIFGGAFQSFRIDGGVFKEVFSISGGEFKSFSTKGGEFQSWFHISGGEFQSEFSIDGGEFQSWFRIYGGEFQSEFRIYGGEFQSEFSIDGGEFIKSILLDNAHSESAYFHQVIFNVPSLITQKVTIQSGCKINQLVLKEGIASGGALYIHSIQVQQLIFDGFANEGVLEITQIRSKSYQVKKVPIPFKDIEKPTPIHLFKKQLLFLHSNLDNAVFKGVNFESFDQIIINDSKLNNISTVNRHFPTSGSKVGSQLSEDNTMLQEKDEMAEIYNQLYLAMQKQGNRKWELAYYGAYLDWERKATKYWWNRLPLNLHKVSTSYGKSWQRAFLWIVGLGIFLYNIYIFRFEGVKFSWQSLFDADALFFHLSHYFQFLLPTHKINFVQAKTPNLAVIIDIIWRIVSGYLLYQMIAAFRRFGKK